MAIVIMMPVNAATQMDFDDAIKDQAGMPGTNPQLSKQLMAEPIAASSLSPVVTETGKISWSIDGLGVSDTTGTIQVEKPAGATVKSAYMAAATTGTRGYPLVPGNIKIDGADVVWTNEIASSISSYNYWADVTSLVKEKIDAAPVGRVDFTITETPAYITDGELLVVIFDDSAQTTDNTIILMFGAQPTTGGDFNIPLAEPIDRIDPNLVLDFSLASSFSNQDNDDQYSIVDVNGNRMTSWAGGDDEEERIFTPPTRRASSQIFSVRLHRSDGWTADPARSSRRPGSPP